MNRRNIPSVVVVGALVLSVGIAAVAVGQAPPQNVSAAKTKKGPKGDRGPKGKKGPKGDKGAQGVPGPQGPVVYSKTPAATPHDSITGPIAPGATGSTAAFCGNERALNGGYAVLDDPTDFAVVESRPVAPDGWTATVINNGAAPIRLRVVVGCIPGG